MLKLKYLLILFTCLFFCIQVNAQETEEVVIGEMTCNVPFYKLVDEYVMFNNDEGLFVGFIYLDMSAGFTLHIIGTIEENGFKPMKETQMKMRLTNPNAVFCSFSNNVFSGLDISQEPDWLSIYNDARDIDAGLLKYGYWYNHIGQCEKALDFLEPLFLRKPDYDGLVFEITYAYNHLGMYEKAIPILQNALKLDSQDFMAMRELGFAHMRMGNLEKAEQVYEDGISVSTSDAQSGEMAVNMAISLYNIIVQNGDTPENRTSCLLWATRAKEYLTEDNELYEYAVQIIQFLEQN